IEASLAQERVCTRGRSVHVVVSPSGGVIESVSKAEQVVISVIRERICALQWISDLKELVLRVVAKVRSAAQGICHGDNTPCIIWKAGARITQWIGDGDQIATKIGKLAGVSHGVACRQRQPLRVVRGGRLMSKCICNGRKVAHTIARCGNSVPQRIRDTGQLTEDGFIRERRGYGAGSTG